MQSNDVVSSGGVLDPPSSLGEMILRAVGIYIGALLIVRLAGEGRFLGKHAAFDILLGIVFGSMISRPANTSAPFLETMAVGAVLVGLHWAFGALAFRWHLFGNLVKGRPVVLVDAGEICWPAMRTNHFTERDLMEALRLHGVDDTRAVKTATLERNGKVSVVLARREPRVVEISVQAGVQTVRVELSPG
jgi:uncharacterized membrane protein YcaP (DUF421 family)